MRILDVKYNASNNELVRTQTLVKNAIVEVDAAPFKVSTRSWAFALTFLLGNSLAAT